MKLQKFQSWIHLAIAQTQQSAAARIFPPGLPILVGFREQILPALVAIWAIALGGFALTRQESFIPGGVWATWTRAVFFTLAVLVMGYPCALEMATPLAMIRGGGMAAK